MRGLEWGEGERGMEMAGRDIERDNRDNVLRGWPLRSMALVSHKVCRMCSLKCVLYRMCSLYNVFSMRSMALVLHKVCRMCSL